ncbi:MAG: hypothetical protein KGI52_12550, partial [Burkholderiales bacterium]|nr:hypothetical protein [Burkholderiales bacterium]
HNRYLRCRNIKTGALRAGAVDTNKSLSNTLHKLTLIAVALLGIQARAGTVFNFAPSMGFPVTPVS